MLSPRSLVASAAAVVLGLSLGSAKAQTAPQAPPNPAPAVTTLGGSLPMPGAPALPGGRPPGALRMAPFGAGGPAKVNKVAGGHSDAEAEEHGGGHGGAHHCPGHGPTDPPPHVNWFHGLLGVDNEKAQAGSAFDKLLFRYENKDDACDPKNEAPPFLAQLINFGLLAFILVKAGKKPIAAALAKRKETMMADIDSAAKLKAEAAARLEEFEQKFASMSQTLAAAKAEYAAAAELEKKRVLDDAEALRTRMRRDAEFRIEQEIKATRLALLREATDAAVEQAETLLKAQVSAADHARLADDYVRALGKSVEPARSSVGGAA